MKPLRFLRHLLGGRRGIDVLDWALVVLALALMLRLILGGEGCRVQF